MLNIINLDRRTDRWQTVESRLKSITDLRYQRVSAIDGKDLSITPEYVHLLRNNTYRNQRNILAYSLTSMQLWQRLLEQKDQPYSIILEDDLTFSPNFSSQLSQMIEQIKSEGQHYDLVMFGYMVSSDDPKYGQPPSVNNNTDPTDQEIKIERMDQHPYFSGSFGYLITRRGATKLLRLIQLKGLLAPVDTIFLHCLRGNIKGIQIMGTLPRLVFTQVADETNQVDSDIQRDVTPVPYNFRIHNFVESNKQDGFLNNDQTRDRPRYVDFRNMLVNKYFMISSSEMRLDFDNLPDLLLIPLVPRWILKLRRVTRLPVLIWVEDPNELILFSQELLYPAKNFWWVTSSSIVFSLIKQEKETGLLVNPKQPETFYQQLEKEYCEYYQKEFNHD